MARILNRSWWYAFCLKCHTEDVGIPTWEPPKWQTFCPYPLCPSYRRVAQVIAIVIIVIVVWLMFWIIMRESAAPGGQFYGLVMLTLAAHFGGWLVLKITTLPGLIGMLMVGVLLKNVGFINLDATYQVVASYIRKIALTIILTRAGLDLDPVALKQHFYTVIELALIPWTFECTFCAVLAYYFLGLPWDWAFLLSTIFAAVSPAVIVPCLFRLRSLGYGVSKGIPTLVLAVAGVDDTASVATYGIVESIMFSSYSLTRNLIEGPLSVLCGLMLGIFCGYLVKYIPERNDPFLVPLRVLMLMAGGLLMVIGADEIGWPGAGPLAVISFAFVACKHWTELGWELADNPVATAFEVFWMFIEPVIFGLTGAQVVIAELNRQAVLVGGGIIITCTILRACVTSLSAVKSNLNKKEKVFLGFAWMAKATVQAALGPVALDEVRKRNGDQVLIGYAETVLTICIMSIVITAPIGAVVITISGPKLLSSTNKPPVLEGWRRTYRPSIRDIYIDDEFTAADNEARAMELEDAKTESETTHTPRRFRARTDDASNDNDQPPSTPTRGGTPPTNPSWPQ